MRVEEQSGVVAQASPVTRRLPAASVPPRRRRTSFIDKTLAGLAGAFERSLYSEEVSARHGLLQGLDPRVKLLGLLLLIIAAASSRSLVVVVGVYALAVALALASSVSPRTLAERVWIGALIFTGVIAFPALFLTPGRSIAHVPLLSWAITAQGLKSAAFLLARVITSATLALTLVLTTPWIHVLKALRVLRVPVIFVVILSMTYRYIFLLLQTAQDMFESRQSRAVGVLDGAERRRVASASVGVLLGKSFQLSSDVYLAMQSRGFRGEVHTLDDFQMRTRDWLGLAGFVVLAALVFWLGLATRLP
ncbi:MAG: cobalt ECF transporter T component CbiQ [Thermomicrobiales bacterium]